MTTTHLRGMARLFQVLRPIVFLVSLYIGARPVGPLPALGSLLDPANGLWGVAANAQLPAHATAVVADLGDSVRVLYDPRGVPHIFASSHLDAVRALGFVVARDRLFQLEIQTRAAHGTLTELVGATALEADRLARRIGLAWSAGREWAAMEPDDRAALEAFAAGVNAYLDGLTRDRLPIEYHLLGAWPQRWQPVHSIDLHRRMGYTLSYRTDEFRRERVIELVGARATDALFPIHAPIVEPIVPGGREYPAFDSTPMPRPELRQRVGTGGRQDGRTAAAVSAAGGDGLLGGGAAGWRGTGLGSNNWAVGAEKSATGHPLLAGDPHLELTLPSIWYEVHLVVDARNPSASPASSAGRGSGAGLDIYGVTIPGAPGVIIGFNRDVAWSFTNTEIDVIDYYRETVDDAARPTRYRVDGEWRPLEVRIEPFLDPDGGALAIDTIYHTHRGPTVRREGTYYSIRWTLLESRNSWRPFHRIATARSADEWMKAMREFDVPSQNGLVADRHGTIAIQSAGRYPIRPGNGRGDRVFDGSVSANDWIGELAPDRLPLVRNPPQGYVASANQEPFDPRAHPGYLSAHWYAPWRAMRINALLRAKDAVTVDEMRRVQTDPRTERAELFVPLFLRAAGLGEGTGAQRAEGDTLVARAAELLSEWDRTYPPDNRRSVLFEMAMDELESRVWDELRDPESGRIVWWPSEAVLWRLTFDAGNAWWDARHTEPVENRDDILVASLRAALAAALAHHGDPAGDGWRWDHVQTANIYHYLSIPSLSELGIAVQGGPGALNPLSGRGTDGASWRMVVELGRDVRAWTTYPGGQSGNPLSSWYTDRIPMWAEGRLANAIVPHTRAQMETGPVASRLTLLRQER